MKANTLSTLIVILSMIINVQAKERDEAQIRTTIESFAAFADQSAFEYLGQLFHKEVTVDYTSLFGGTAAQTNNIDLMKQWAGLLPGFDVTRHDLSNITVSINEDKAIVKADITASHYLGETGFWQISGVYNYQLININNHWKITHLTLLVDNEKGDRTILAKAGKLAEERLAEKNLTRVKYQN